MIQRAGGIWVWCLAWCSCGIHCRKLGETGWSFSWHAKCIEPQADAFAREKMKIRHSQHWPELRCNPVREDHLLTGSLQNLPSWCWKWKVADLRLVAAPGICPSKVTQLRALNSEEVLRKCSFYGCFLSLILVWRVSWHHKFRSQLKIHWRTFEMNNWMVL